MTRGQFQIDPSKEFPSLRHAPIVEAVLQWQAAASVALNAAELQGQLRESFPEYELASQQNIETALTGFDKGMELKHSATWEGFRLTKKEGDVPIFVCQFKQNGLVFSRLSPYRGWTEFASEALRFWDEFVKVGKPTEIARLSTRYISQIPIKSITEVAEFIDVFPQPLSAIGVSADGFFHQDSVTLDDLPYTINLIRAVQPRQQHGAADKSLIVDIGVSTLDSISDFDTLNQTLADLRFIKNAVFFTLMKDAEKKFGGNDK